MKVHVLDTSALNDLVSPSAALVRHRLLSEVDDERIVVLATDPLVWELPGTRTIDEPKYVAMCQLLVRVTRGRVMLRPAVRRDRELRTSRALVFPEFVDDERQFSPVFDADVVDREAALRAGFVRGLRFAEAEKAADSIRALDEEERRQRVAQGQPAEQVGSAWRAALKRANRSHKYILGFAESFAQDDIADAASKLGIDVSTMSPRTLPTPWTSALIHVARIRAVVVGGTSPIGRRSANQIDLVHLEEASAYADVFVCGDRALRAFAGTVPELRCEVLSFEEWGTRLTR